jgi:hypothetical protein
MEMPRLFAPALIVALAIGAVSEAGAQGTDGLAERWSSYRDFWFRHDSVRLDASDVSKVSEISDYTQCADLVLGPNKAVGI